MIRFVYYTFGSWNERWASGIPWTSPSMTLLKPGTWHKRYHVLGTWSILFITHLGVEIRDEQVEFLRLFPVRQCLGLDLGTRDNTMLGTWSVLFITQLGVEMRDGQVKLDCFQCTTSKRSLELEHWMGKGPFWLIFIWLFHIWKIPERITKEYWNR